MIYPFSLTTSKVTSIQTNSVKTNISPVKKLFYEVEMQYCIFSQAISFFIKQMALGISSECATKYLIQSGLFLLLKANCNEIEHL